MIMVRATPGARVGFNVIAGPNTGAAGGCWDGAGPCVADDQGSVYWTYASGPNPGDDTIEVYMDADANGVRDTGEGAGNTTQTWYRYVAVGDSYSAGEGIDPYYPGGDTGVGTGANNCHRSPRGHPVLLGAKQNPASSYNPYTEAGGFTFLSCSSARTENVRHDLDPNVVTDGAFPQHNQLTQLDAGPGVDDRTGLVTVTIGGNNMRFSDILELCAFKLECQEETFDEGMTLEDWITTNANDLVGQLRDLYLEIKQNARSDTTILTTGYPLFFPTTIRQQNCDKLLPSWVR